jgi:hypothetical protein
VFLSKRRKTAKNSRDLLTTVAKEWQEMSEASKKIYYEKAENLKLIREAEIA